MLNHFNCYRIVSVRKVQRFIATYLNLKVKTLLPPRVAEMRMCVPYFLMMVSMNCWVVGLRPSKRTLRWNSGMSGTGFRIRSLLSIAVFLTFQRANSLLRTQEHLGTKPHKTCRYVSTGNEMTREPIFQNKERCHFLPYRERSLKTLPGSQTQSSVSVSVWLRAQQTHPHISFT